MILPDLEILFQDFQKYDQKGHFVISFSDVTKNLFYDKSWDFQKEKNGIGVVQRKSAEVDQNWFFVDFKVEFKEVHTYIFKVGCVAQC